MVVLNMEGLCSSSESNYGNEKETEERDNSLEDMSALTLSFHFG